MNRLLSVLGALLALLTAAVAVCMVYPAWNRVGLMRALVLFYPLHILVLRLVAFFHALVCARRGALGAGMLFTFTALLSLGMALLPAITNWRTARRLSVPLSFRDYLTKGRNTGAP